MKQHPQLVKTSPQIACGRTSLRSLSAASVLATGIVLSFGIGSTAATAGGDPCKTTTMAAGKACTEGARSDYNLALGKCANIADPVARKACQVQAKSDMKDALATCKAQTAARLAACARLGKATFEPSIVASNFVGAITNSFMPLIPGTTFTYVSSSESNVVAVTHNTKMIDGVTCVEVHDTVYRGGVLAEDTLDWFAQDRDGNVWYFGENTHELDGNEITNIDGSFKGGTNGAQPGIVMKANPTVGDFYRQEFDLDNAEDVAEVISLTNSVTVASGTFTNCLVTLETSPLEPEAMENKYYASGVGNVLVIDLVTAERLELISVTNGP
jgi:hypothetical protein